MYNTQSNPEVDYNSKVDNDRDMLIRLCQKLDSFVQLKSRLEKTVDASNMNNVEDLFLENCYDYNEENKDNDTVSGIGNLDLAKIGFYSANQDIYKQNGLLVKKLASQIDHLSSHGTQLFVKALYNRQFDEEFKERSIQIQKEDVQALEQFSKLVQRLAKGEVEFLKSLAEQD